MTGWRQINSMTLTSCFLSSLLSGLLPDFFCLVVLNRPHCIGFIDFTTFDLILRFMELLVANGIGFNDATVLP